MGIRHMGDDLVEGQRRGVDDQRAGRRGGEDFGRHQRAGIEADRAALDQPQPAHGDQIGRAGAGADEMHRHRARAVEIAARRIERGADRRRCGGCGCCRRARSSACRCRRSASSDKRMIRCSSPSRPRLRPMKTGVSGERCRSRISAASARRALPPRRARVVERDDEIGRRRRFEASPDRLPRGHQIRQRDRAEIVAERRAGPGGGGLQRRDAGTDGELDRPPFRLRLRCRAARRRAAPGRKSRRLPRRRAPPSGPPRRDRAPAAPAPPRRRSRSRCCCLPAIARPSRSR